MTQLIDSHTHIYAEEFDEDFSDMLQRAEESGVTQMVLPCVDCESWPLIHSLSEAHPQRLFPTIGLHPTYVKEDYEAQLSYLEQHLEEGIVAIGEIGLDYYWDTTFKAEQLKAFERQVRWAHRLGLPVILHVREAFRDTFDLLRSLQLPGLRGVFHSFTGSREELQEALYFEHFYIGINGVVTFKNSSLKEYVSDIPLDRLVVETDAPYLAPVPKRGRRNEPAFLPYTASFVASCYQISDEELCARTSENARRLFALPTR